MIGRELSAFNGRGSGVLKFAFAQRFREQSQGLLGTDMDSERAIRWLIALMVPCCAPLAIAPDGAAWARRAYTDESSDGLSILTIFRAYAARLGTITSARSRG
jgi:hypothetical protein